MTHHLYALLVGINRYNPCSGVSTLRGCTNDARAMKAYLEARVASRAQLHVQMLLDEQATRQAINSSIVSLEELEIEKAETTRTRSLNETTAGWQMPQGRHVLIAACRDTEEASEYYTNSRHGGAFSHFLLETLQKTNGSLTCRDLFKATYARICAQISAQSPQLEAPYLEDLDRPFWGGAIAQAFVTDVRPQLSYVQVEGALDCEATYKAVITGVPVPPFLTPPGIPAEIGPALG